MLTISDPASVISSAPVGSTRSEAWIWVPAQDLDRDLHPVRNLGGLDGQLHMFVLDRDDRFDLSDATRLDRHVNVDLLALRTTTRSMCSMTGRIGSRWTSLARAR